MHFVRIKNLRFSPEVIRLVTKQCHVCAELKPCLFKLSGSTLIKSAQRFERLSVDFKGRLPSTTRNKYLLTVVDEYSRFPFTYPCPDIYGDTVSHAAVCHI
ncbi:hypothetical protein CLF_103896 [Clonorchis sinensis]|uniref:Integrase catalytic domain-containing protein n=1 Tax=Clonorchis sinensis TaxID=79923 RepID=G7YAK6_CLOSI|nr:hypothetical protein CLF_103896 [Clonorchis sinensis]